MNPIYLDYAASTPVDPRVAEKMMLALTSSCFAANSLSLHDYGVRARELIEEARARVASVLHALPEEIIWTSGATESNNLALKGAAKLYQQKGKHIITMKTEHKSVLETCQYLEKSGFSVTYLRPQQDGLLDLRELEATLRPDTMLVSVMHVNNETGVVQDISAIGALTSARGILLHVDAAQSPGKIEIDVNKVPVDLLSLCAHKCYGPQGVGVLYIRKKPRVRVEPLFHGGGHEQGMRSGTLPVHQIVGMGEACYLTETERLSETTRIQKLRDQFWQALQSIPCCYLNARFSLPHFLNVRFEGMLADALLAKLPFIATSSASACEGKGTEGSYVLRAMGYSTEQAKSAIRFSLGRFTTTEDIINASEQIKAVF
ncbi:MAG TPA: aminotransferase class V-fold PLP-dependent enzyme [Gammaproteobacteria bacterium]|jgi:cysteine desulfurase|nr:aminotransferase class V-fold PLP-dependent enzyme [Gammaproteobacteria bacterium]